MTGSNMKYVVCGIVYASMDRRTPYPAFDPAHARERIDPDDDFVIVDDYTPNRSSDKFVSAMNAITAVASAANTFMQIVAPVPVTPSNEPATEPASNVPRQRSQPRTPSTPQPTPRPSSQPTPQPTTHCTRCGHSNHSAESCYAKRNAYGRPVGSAGRPTQKGSGGRK